MGQATEKGRCASRKQFHVTAAAKHNRDMQMLVSEVEREIARLRSDGAVGDVQPVPLPPASKRQKLFTVDEDGNLEVSHTNPTTPSASAAMPIGVTTRGGTQRDREEQVGRQRCQEQLEDSREFHENLSRVCEYVQADAQRLMQERRKEPTSVQTRDPHQPFGLQVLKEGEPG